MPMSETMPAPDALQADARDQFIPVRKSELLDALAAALPDANERGNFRQACRLLASIFHYEYFERLEQLRDAYYYFNPELPNQSRFDAAALARAYDELVEAFVAVLKGANFVEVSQAEIERAHRESALLRVELRAPVDDFHAVRFFRRGRHRETFDIPEWFGWRSRPVELEVYDDVVLFVAMKPPEPAASKRDAKRIKRRNIRPGAVLIKYFRNIASADLNALYPNVKVVMSLFDKLMLGVPALVGGVPILINLASTVVVLFVVLGFYLGVSGAVEDNQMKKAFAALSGLVALGGFLMRQWVKYQRQSLKYQKQVADTVYFRNVNNNAGIFDYMIGAAEEQECKEAFLAYHFLHVADTAPTEDELDRRIEAWLKREFAVDIDFEVDDALAKLERLGLLRNDGGRLSVLPLDEALVTLDRHWDGIFQYANAPAPAVAAARV